jgi:hypothetical protein
MNLSFIAEVWDLLNYYVDVNDRPAAATTLVDFLVDNNYSVDEIKSAFVGEKEVLKSLAAFDSDDVDYIDDEDDIDEDNDW